MNVLSRSTTKTTRAGMLLQGARILLVSFLGWAAGAVVIWRFGSGSLQNDVGLLVLGAVLWAAIPLTTLRLLRRRSGTLRMERPRTWGIWFVIASLTGSAVIVIVRPMTEDWTSLQIWSAIFLLTPIGIALDTVPRLIRPAGWTSIGASTRKPIPLVLLAGSLVTFAVAVALMVGGEVAVVAVVLSLVVLGAYAVGVPLVAYGGIGLLYAGVSVLAQFTWLPVVGGLVEVDATALLAVHVMAALALIVATAVIQVFRDAEPSWTEIAIVDWLRSEAVLPEKPAVEGNATT